MGGILVTGFEPFGGDTFNASWQAVSRFAELWDGSDALVTAELPVTFDAAGDALVALVDEHRPSVVIAVGEAGGRAGVTPEHVAVNRKQARIPDNSGVQPVGEPVRQGGPDRYRTGLDVEACVAAIRAAGVPAHPSDSAGEFVCNAAFYALMATAESRPGLRAGFIHVPAVRGATGELSIDQLARALLAAVRVSR